jgi:hypothetical protein
MIALLEGDGMIIPPSGITRQAMPEALSAPIDTFMPTPSFHDWLGNRAQEAPAADNLATLIASAGAAGVSVDRLRRVVGLPPEVLADVLKSLVATGQVEMLRVTGELRYRAVG